jgi:hypothetical protein
LAAHTQSINIIMTTLQVVGSRKKISGAYCWLLNLYQNTLKNQDRKRNAEYRSMIGTIQDATFQCMAKLVEMTATITLYVCICSPAVLA